MSKVDEAKKNVFEVTRKLVIQLQEAERLLMEHLEKTRKVKESHLRLLQADCTHDRIVEMAGIGFESLRTFYLFHGMLDKSNTYNVRVCQICGLVNVQSIESGYPIIGQLDDKHVPHARLERPNHSYWTVEEYLRLKPRYLLKPL